jgi:transketolase
MAARWTAFGWQALTVDGHDVGAILEAFGKARATAGRPTVVLARTIKGKGVSFTEDKNGWHGKPLKKGEELDAALRELEAQLVDDGGAVLKPERPATTPNAAPPARTRRSVSFSAYADGDMVATREAYGTALALLGDADDTVVALDADVKNSTFSETVREGAPRAVLPVLHRGAGHGGGGDGPGQPRRHSLSLDLRRFLSRAATSSGWRASAGSNVKLAGSHAGVSIGEDGPSQMALEDLAMMRAVPGCSVVYPCDAVSAERLVVEMAYTPGPAYMRTSRPKTPVIYGADETFPSAVPRCSAGAAATSLPSWRPASRCSRR